MTRWKNWFKCEAGRVNYMAFEWWIMRIALACLVYRATPTNFPSVTVPMPVGIAKFVDVSWVAAPGAQEWMHPLLVGLCVVFALGVLPLLSSAGLLALHTAVYTFKNSQGAGGGAHHTTNVIGLLLIGQVLGCLYMDFKAVRRAGWKGLWAARLEQWEWLRHVLRHPAAAFRKGDDGAELPAQLLRNSLVYTTQQLLAVVYVVSGITKLWRSDGGWISEVRNLPLQFEKNRMNEYYDTLIMPPQTAADSMGEWIANHPHLAGIFFGGGLFVELFGFLALWNRRMGVIIGLGAIAMHLAISRLMSLDFIYNEWALLIFWVNVPFWIWLLVVRMKHPRLHPA